MDCRQIEREEIVEKYLTGRLDPADQEAFERHYFDCSDCRQRLQVCRMLQEKLWEKGGDVLPRSGEERRVPIGRRAWAYSAGAAALLFAVLGWWLFRGPGHARVDTKGLSPSLAILARIEPPPYIPSSLRRTEDETAERFRLGMESYGEGRYREALPDLRAAAQLSPGRPSIRFFLGICLLLTRQTDAGIEELKRTIELGDSAYLEEAHFYLAKALLARGDIGRAKAELNTIIERGGKLKGEAAGILVQLK